jgi:RNA polymerase sigma-70 factor, ECF subfamily
VRSISARQKNPCFYPLWPLSAGFFVYSDEPGTKRFFGSEGETQMGLGMNEQSEVTQMPSRPRGGDQQADGQLDPMVYRDLRRIAGSMMRGLRPGHTLQPTAVVHEAYLRMKDGANLDLVGRAHFFAKAAQAMRWVLVDHARRKQATIHGGGLRREEFPDDFALPPEQVEEVLALHEALERLESLDPRQAKVVEMHYYAGTPVDEIAAVLNIGERTVKRDLQTARLFLKRQLERKPTNL